MSFYWRFVRPITFTFEARSFRELRWRAYYGLRIIFGLQTP